jgi:hypothetical protein
VSSSPSAMSLYMPHGTREKSRLPWPLSRPPFNTCLNRGTNWRKCRARGVQETRVLGSPDNLSVSYCLNSTTSSPTMQQASRALLKGGLGEMGLYLVVRFGFIASPCGALRGSAVSPRLPPKSLRSSNIFQVVVGIRCTTAVCEYLHYQSSRDAS